MKRRLTEHLENLKDGMHRVAHDRADLSDYRDLVLYALLRQRDTVSHADTADSRGRINFGRPAARQLDGQDTILIAVGRPALRGCLVGHGPVAAGDEHRVGPRQIDRSPDRIGHYTCSDRRVILSERDLDVIDLDGPDGPPVWSSEQRVAAPYTRALRSVLDRDTDAYLEHTTTLGTVAALHMVRNSAFGYYEINPPLGRTGRVSLRDEHAELAVAAVLIPRGRLALPIDDVAALAEQDVYDPSNQFCDLPDVDAPSNGFLEA